MPAISAFSEALLDVATSAKKGQGGIEDLAKDGSLADWAQKAVIGVAYVVDIFQGLWGIIKTVGQAIGAIMAHGMNVASTLGDAFVAIVKANYSELPDIVRRGTNAMRSINAEFAADFQENLFPKELFSDKVKARMALQAQAAGKEIKKNLNFALKEDKGEKDIVDHLGKSLDDLFNKLSSPIDPELMKDIALLTKGFQLGRISIDAYAFGLLEATRQSKSFKDANDEIAKSLKENEDALNKNRQAVEDAMQALKDHIRGIDEEIGAIGLSKVERERYNLQLKRTADLRRIDATLSGEEAEMRRAEVDAFYNAAEAAVGGLEAAHDRQEPVPGRQRTRSHGCQHGRVARRFAQKLVDGIGGKVDQGQRHAGHRPARPARSKPTTPLSPPSNSRMTLAALSSPGSSLQRTLTKAPCASAQATGPEGEAPRE